MVAEWSGRQQEGTDADSIALLKSKSRDFSLEVCDHRSSYFTFK